MESFPSRIKTQPNVKQCKADFRVEKRDIPLLLDALRAPPVSQCRNGTICDAVEGCVLDGFMVICPKLY